ncbi:hypothetical protein CsSME_00052417 [Camellia sinensis var. sinensis]
MWSSLPFDLLANIFSLLSPDTLARARSACRHWNTLVCRQPPWLVALPTRHRGLFCYAHNPIIDKWHVLPLDFVPDPVRPIAPIRGLILLRHTSTTTLQLAICNPFTRQYKTLPMLIIARTNPAVGLIELGSSPTQHVSCPYFLVYVAGGMSEAPHGAGASYEATLEMYDSRRNTWQVIGPMPMEFAVRLTVWTPNESVYSNGVLYWMTSARAYSFAALVPRNKKLVLIGGVCRGDAFVWELGEDGAWNSIGKVPFELGVRFLGGNGSWGMTKWTLGQGWWFGGRIGRKVGGNGIGLKGVASLEANKFINFLLKVWFFTQTLLLHIC